MNRKFYGLFIKRLYKWLFLLCCLIGMLIPLIHVSKSYIRNIVEQNLTWDIQESIDMMEHDFNKAHQMMNILSSEEPFQKLIKNKGEIPVDQYVYLSRLQTKLSQLSIIFDLDMMSYLVFRDTPVFISNRGCTDNYAKLMPFPLEFAEEGAKAWHDSLFDNTSSYQILPNLEFINPDFTYSGTGIVFIINSMHNSIPNDKCRLVTMIDCTQMIDKLLKADLVEDTFVCITDQNDRILYQYNLPAGTNPAFTQGMGDILLDGKHFQLFERSSELWELRMVCGMSDSVIEQHVQKTMVGWVSFYIGAGLCVIIILSLVFSLRETRSIAPIIEAATLSTDTEYTKDEYSFINHAFEKLNRSNQEKQEQINVLNHQIEAGILESLIMRGSYAVKEQSDFLESLNGHFQFFCVTIFSYYTAGENLSPMEQQQLYVMTEEIMNREALLPYYYSCFLVMAPTELACVLSLRPDEPVSLNRVRSRLLGAMKILNDQLEQEEWNTTVCAGISKPAYNLANIRTAYLQAKNALSLENQIHSGEVYQYAPPQTAALKKSFESVKYQYCYDHLIRGNKKEILDFFDDLDKELCHLPQNDQETMQFFFALREPIYSAYILILSNEDTNENNAPAFPQYISGYTVEQISKDYRGLCLRLCEIVEKNRRSYNDANVRKIIGYIDRHFTDPSMTSAQVAEAFLVSEKYLYNVVKGTFGMTFGKYIENLRIRKAESLLLSTELTNIQIYQQCGFGSENTFYRNFLKSHGMTPTAWKAKKQAENGTPS